MAYQSYTPNYQDQSYKTKEAGQINFKDILNQGYSVDQAYRLTGGPNHDGGANYVQHYGGLDQAAKAMNFTADTSKPASELTYESLKGMGYNDSIIAGILNNPIDTHKAFTLDNNGNPQYETNSGQGGQSQTQTYTLNGQTFTTKPGEQIPVGGSKVSDSTGNYQQIPISGQLGAIGNGVNNNTSGTNGASSSDLANQYNSLLGNTSGVDSAQKAIDDQNNALRTGVHNVQDQPIGMSFISGQQASLENRNTDLQIPLQQQLANAQQKRQASLDAVKFQLDRSDKATARQDTLNQNSIDNTYRQSQATNTANKLTEVSPGATLYNPATNKSVYTAPTTKALNPTTTTTKTVSLAKKSNESKATYVERALAAQKLSYDTVMKSIPAGMKGVLVNKTGQIGYIPESEYNTAIYTAL